VGGCGGWPVFGQRPVSGGDSTFARSAMVDEGSLTIESDGERGPGLGENSAWRRLWSIYLSFCGGLFFAGCGLYVPPSPSRMRERLRAGPLVSLIGCSKQP